MKTISNEAKLKRLFSNCQPLEAIVTGLTYIRVEAKYHYICFILDLFNREIIGYSCGQNKIAIQRIFRYSKGDVSPVEA